MLAELPNWKIGRKTKTPAKLRDVLSKNGSDYLNSCLNSVKSINRGRPQSAIGKFGVKKKKVKAKGKVENLEESIELIAMKQFRTGLMKEIGRSGEMTPERLEFIRRSSVQKEFLDLGVYREKKQRDRMKKELLSRSPLDNAIYMLKAMPLKSRKTVVKELYDSIPGGTRFLRSKGYKS